MESILYLFLWPWQWEVTKPLSPLTQGHCASTSFKEKRKDKVKIPKEGVITCCSELFHILLSFLFASGSQPLLPMQYFIYPDSGVRDQFSSGLSWDFVGIWGGRTEGKESKYESRETDRFTKPRFFCILISPRFSYSLVRLAWLVELTQLQLFFLASSLSGLIGWRLDWTPRISGPTFLWNKLSLVESGEGLWFLWLASVSVLWDQLSNCQFHLGLNWFSFIHIPEFLAQFCFSVFLS